MIVGGGQGDCCCCILMMIVLSVLNVNSLVSKKREYFCFIMKNQLLNIFKYKISMNKINLLISYFVIENFLTLLLSK